MSLNVSSGFVERAQASRAEPRRHFSIGGSDYSAHVLRWPRIRFSAKTIDLGTCSIRLVNEAGQFDFFVNSDLALTTSCALELGFADPSGVEERVSVYLGAPSHVSFEQDGTELQLQLQGKTRCLHDIGLGADTDSGGLDFTTSAYHPSDLAWTLVTCYGGLSALQSSANPDVHYDEWLAWKDSNTIRDVRVQGYFTGEKIFQVLDALALMDSVIISFQDGQLRFHDMYESYGAGAPAFPQAPVMDVQLAINPSEVTNQFRVEAAYDPSAARFQEYYVKVHSRSQQEFGLRSGRFGSRSVWFAGGADGRYMAEDAVGFHHRPQPAIGVTTTFAGGVQRGVGDVVTLTHSLLGIAGREYRITELAIDLDDGTLGFDLEPANHRPWQYLATVADSVNLSVQTIQAVASETWLGVSESSYTPRIYRSNSAGTFVPMACYGSQLLVLNGTEVIFGGPPSSGSTQSVLSRSSDAGSSTTVVQTLAAGIAAVQDIFQVKSGTLLASATSGGIWRSTDAGSSWALTWTISGQLQINQFFRPYSGALWGGTGYRTAGTGFGCFLWQSLDDGATWAPKHTVISTGDYSIHGLYHLTDSEFLLSTYGSAASQRGVYRSQFASVNSIAWTLVGSRISFTHMVATDSGDLLMGFDEPLSVDGGTVHRSTDQGSTWIEENKIAKRGNVRLVNNGDGTIDAFMARMSAGYRTDRYRNYHPTDVP